jgi:Protein of unknown function (DUF2934)
MATTNPHNRQRVMRPPTVRGRNRAARAGSAAAAGIISPQARLAMISDAGYFMAERRGFCPGHELEDWLAAETRIDLDLAAGSGIERGGMGLSG